MEEPDLVANAQAAIDEARIAGRVTVELSPVPGVVRLLGQVVSEVERLRADQAARSAEGVMDVIDDITLGRRAPER